MLCSVVAWLSIRVAKGRYPYAKPFLKHLFCPNDFVAALLGIKVRKYGMGAGVPPHFNQSGIQGRTLLGPGHQPKFRWRRSWNGDRIFRKQIVQGSLASFRAQRFQVG